MTPTITATLTKSGKQLTFRCPHCRYNHYHGLGGGHVQAHCPPGSPYQQTGYYRKRDTRSDQPCVSGAPDTVPTVSRRRRGAVATTPATGGHPINPARDDRGAQA